MSAGVMLLLWKSWDSSEKKNAAGEVRERKMYFVKSRTVETLSQTLPFDQRAELVTCCIDAIYA